MNSNACKIYYCYKATNDLNDKVYIGFATNPQTRWRNHKRDADKGKGYAFQAAIRKYGWEHFHFEVICCGKDKLAMLEYVEPALIEQHQSSVEKNGYNIRRTAMIAPCFLKTGKPSSTRIKLGQRLSPTTEFQPGHKMSAFTGHHHTEEAKNRIKSKMQTLLLDPAKRERHRIAALGNLSRTGQRQSIEERNKHKLSSEVVDCAKTFRAAGLTYEQIAVNLNGKGMFNRHGKEWTTKAASSLFERIRKENSYPDMTYKEWRSLQE